MSESTVRSILRIIAVVTILIGVTMTISVVFTLLVATRATHGGLGGEVAIIGLVPPLVVVAEGFLLFVVSQALALRIIQ